jgi:hypothetical protein
MQIDKQAGRLPNMQAGRQAGRQAGKQAGRQVGRIIDMQAGRQTGWRSSRQAGRQASRQAGKQAGRQVGRIIDMQAGRQTGWRSSRQAGGQVRTHIYTQKDRPAGRQAGRQAALNTSLKCMMGTVTSNPTWGAYGVGQAVDAHHVSDGETSENPHNRGVTRSKLPHIERTFTPATGLPRAHLTLGERVIETLCETASSHCRQGGGGHHGASFEGEITLRQTMSDHVSTAAFKDRARALGSAPSVVVTA